MSKPTVTFGEFMLRLAPPGMERFLQSPLLVATFGGGEANVAVALASLGAPAAYVTVLPEKNPIADAAIGELRRFGVDTSQIVRGKGRMGIYFLETGANQRPSKVVYDRDGSAIALARPGAIDWDAALKGAGWFHTTGITPAISESAAELALESVRKARSMGVTVSCDLNYRKNLWKWGKPASAVMSELVKYVDFAIANEEDVQMALGIQAEVDVHAGQLERAQYKKLAEKVLQPVLEPEGDCDHAARIEQRFPQYWSACFHVGKEFLTSRSYEITHIVDRVGGGDSFAGGLIYGLQDLPTPQEALEFAMAASCLKHSIPGDFCRVSRRRGSQALLKGGGSGRVQR